MEARTGVTRRRWTRLRRRRLGLRLGLGQLREQGTKWSARQARPLRRQRQHQHQRYRRQRRRRQRQRRRKPSRPRLLRHRLPVPLPRRLEEQADLHCPRQSISTGSLPRQRRTGADSRPPSSLAGANCTHRPSPLSYFFGLDSSHAIHSMLLCLDRCQTFVDYRQRGRRRIEEEKVPRRIEDRESCCPIEANCWRRADSAIRGTEPAEGLTPAGQIWSLLER